MVGSSYVPNVNLNFDVNNNAIQNGADAIALYQANVADFPDGTVPTSTGLVDALVYGTADPDDAELIAAFGPAADNAGMVFINDDNGADTTVKLILCNGISYYFSASFTKAA